MFYKLFNLQCYNIINKIYCNTFFKYFFIFFKKFFIRGGNITFYLNFFISSRALVYQRPHEPFFEFQIKKRVILTLLSLFIQSYLSAFIIIYPVLLIRIQIAFLKLHNRPLEIVWTVFIQPFSPLSLNSEHLLDVSISSILN